MQRGWVSACLCMAAVLVGSACAQAAARSRCYEIAYATYIGGSQYEQAREVIPLPDGSLLGGSGGEFYLMPTLGPKGNIWMVGNASSRDFPVTPGALQKTCDSARGRRGGEREDDGLADGPAVDRRLGVRETVTTVPAKRRLLHVMPHRLVLEGVTLLQCARHTSTS